MLEQIDLSKKLSKQEYQSRMADLGLSLAALQRKAIDAGLPVILVFEGWNAAGKGTLINRLLQTLDPRHFQVFATRKPTEAEAMRPFLWRFWMNTPPRGRMAIFDRSWYGRVLADRVEEAVKKPVWERAYPEINNFEKLLSEDGALIIKFFLHISKKNQRKRMKALEANSATAWRVTKEDWQHHRNYDDYLDAVRDMLAKTDTRYAPWKIVESEDRRFATVKIFATVVNALTRALEKSPAEGEAATKKPLSVPSADPVDTSILDQVDLSLNYDKEEYLDLVEPLQKKIRDLEYRIYRERIPVVIAYEGWDAAGKGGNIRRLTSKMDPRGYDVVPISAPNDIERRHHYLWRFWREIPKAGHIAIFDRTWYGRVLVERVEGFASELEWRRAYREIREMEEQFTNFGTILVKFWLEIDQEEQLRRFTDRQNDPHKSWKLTDEDWRNREKWPLYKEAVDEMLLRTSTPNAPWTVVESNSKYYARIKVLRTVIKAIEQRLDG
ncbi:MAG: phosphate--AMP phosphotransferase [Calditrichaeota bacterium]|nr:phosphate--AMP phosphotransferase [Calditrichota bacterium]